MVGLPADLASVVQTSFLPLKAEQLSTYRWETRLRHCKTSMLLSVFSQQQNYWPTAV